MKGISRKMKFRLVAAISLIMMLVACGETEDPVGYKSDLTRSDLIDNGDLEGTSLTVDLMNLPRITAKPRDVSPFACQQYFEMRRLQSDKSMVQFVSNDRESFIVSVHPQVNFTGWNWGPIPKSCSTVTFGHNGKSESRFSTEVIKSDFIDDCSDSQIILGDFTIFDGALPDQNVLYAGCALEGPRVYVEVSLINPSRDGSKSSDIKKAHERAVELLQKQVAKLKL